ncbi:MAG TPA: PsiF family protein [Gallionella sp.]
MKKLIALACLGFAVVVSAPAFAGAQQEKMKGCNVEAKADALKGDERRAFMKKCLKKDYTLKADAAAKPEAKPVAKAEAKPAAKAGAKLAASAVAAAPVTQQDKMKSCNADAATKGLKGDERRTFMKTCLKG